MRATRATALALTAACAVFVGACGGETEPSEANRDALGVPLRIATCADWTAADVGSRRAFLDELRGLRGEQISGRGGGRGYGSVLDDDIAYELLEGRCGLPNSESFLLYKIYSFAAGFGGQAP